MTDNTTDSPKKRMDKKKGVMGALAVLMLGWLIYDNVPALLDRQPTPKPASLEDPLFNEVTDTAPNIERITPSLTPHAPPKIEHRAVKEAVEVLPSNRAPQTLTVSLTLPPTTKRALMALESQYQSALLDAANQAKLREATSAKALQAALQPPEVVLPPAVDVEALTPREQVAQLQLKSLVKGKLHASAWFELNGELFPVKAGAWIQDLKVHRLTKNTVVLLDKNGQEYVKYMSQVRPVQEVSEENDDER
uniref:Uncharacterized protein n=2 Tax=Vibrio tasmaniensis TaxID=212663 RepID=A0A0H4A4C1_9VIBR|nr:hypothetical protein [Vibrio tasmaniensis]